LNFGGIDVETKLKEMVTIKGIPVYQLLDEMVEKAWQRSSVALQQKLSPASLVERLERR